MMPDPSLHTDALQRGLARFRARVNSNVMQIEPYQITKLLTIGLHQNLSCSVRAVPFLE